MNFYLYKAYNYGHIDVTKHLLQKGENIQAIKRGGRYTALILGIFYANFL